VHFIVKHINSQNKIAYNVIESRGYEELLEKLNVDKIVYISITSLPSFLSTFIPSLNGRISKDEVVELIENLHLVIKSGLPLHQGILDLAEETNSKQFKSVLSQIANDINKGLSLSKAFEPYKQDMGNMIINLIKIGEETGQLEETLKRGAIFLKKVLSLKKKAKSALIYPSFAFFAVMGAMLVWMIYVLPQMTALFKDMDIELPTITLTLISISNFLSNNIGYIAIEMILFTIMFKILHKKFMKVRWHTDKMILKIPIIKDIVMGFNIAFISEYLRLALISGVPVFSALETLKENLNNELYKEALVSASNDLANGLQLSVAFTKSKLFTQFTLRMISVGESSGMLDTQLQTVSDYYYERVDYYAQNIGKFIEPVILIVVGGFMAVVMLGIMGPMYDMLGKINP